MSITLFCLSEIRLGLRRALRGAQAGPRGRNLLPQPRFPAEGQRGPREAHAHLHEGGGHPGGAPRAADDGQEYHQSVVRETAPQHLR